jgi:hypothetical protein
MNVINEIKTLLGMEVKLAQMKLVDGVTVIEAETFDPEQPVFIVNGEDRVALPVGDYELEDGMMLMVEVEGVIAAMMPMPEEAPAAEEAAPIEAEVEAQAEAPSAAKKIIESVSKETFFAEIKKLTDAIEALKPTVSKEDLKSNVELEAQSVQPLTHSPETKSEIKLTKISPNRPMTTRDRVMAKLFN